MAHQHSSDRPRWLALLASLRAALLAVLIVVYDVARDAPPSFDCNGSATPGHDAAVYAWRTIRTGDIWLVRIGLWWLLAFAAGHLLLIQIAGHGPIAC